MTTENPTQHILTGIDNLDAVLKDIGAGKLLLVADASFPFLNIRHRVEAVSTPYVVFSDFGSNPLYEDVCKGVSLFRQAHCDTILAVGGGSSMDVAKCIKLFCRMNDGDCYLQQDFSDSGIPLVAIPTTAGTGSESTRFAVIYHQGVKQSVTHPSIIPNYAILEPAVLSSLPVYQKKCTVLDALCQGIESWWSINSTPQSHKLSCEAVKTLVDNIEPYIFENSAAAAAMVMQAANKAGQAINITQTTAPHAFSYKLTSLYHLPHGHAVAVCLPGIWEYMLSHPEHCKDHRGTDYLNRIFSDIAEAMHRQSATEAIDCFRALLAKMDISQPKANNREEELAILTRAVNPVRLKNNPVGLDEQAIQSLYNNILL
jgi:alcohol dehydrogenase class IV